MAGGIIVYPDAPEHRPRRHDAARLAAPDRGARRSRLARRGCRGPTGWRAAQRRAVAHAPVRRQQAVVRRMRLAEGRAGKPRHDFAPADREQVAHQRQPLATGSLHCARPSRDARIERSMPPADREPRRHISHRRRRIPCVGPCARPRRDRPGNRRRTETALSMPHSSPMNSIGTHRRQQRDRQRGLDRLRIGDCLRAGRRARGCRSGRGSAGN